MEKSEPVSRPTVHNCTLKQDSCSVSNGETKISLHPKYKIPSLVLGALFLGYVVFSDKQSSDLGLFNKGGIYLAVLIFLVFGFMHAKNGPFIWPHPAFWRLMLCICVLYEVLLVFVLFQNVSDVRFMLTYIDPNLNQPLDFRRYGGKCDLWEPGHPNGPFHNLMDKMDIFVLSHLVGWFVKTLVVRDVWLLNFMSILFELIEYSLEHQLPNFSECWWDHWILDFLICNGLGIYFGMRLLKHFSLKEYRWHELWSNSSCRPEIHTVGSNFKQKLTWRPTTKLSKWLLVCTLAALSLLVELNGFYLKFILWISPNHRICSIRLLAYALWGSVICKEIHLYLHGNTKKVGLQTWLMCAIISTEFLIIVKFGGNILLLPFPVPIKLLWAVLILIFISFTIWKFSKQKENKRRGSFKVKQ